MAPPMANPGSPSVLAETIVIPDSVRSIPETWSGEPEKTLGEALETFSALCSQKFSQNAQATETLASEAEQLLDAMLKNAAQPAQEETEAKDKETDFVEKLKAGIAGFPSRSAQGKKHNCLLWLQGMISLQVYMGLPCESIRLVCERFASMFWTPCH